nr:MAG TPA: hypothetical protein [Caudoviricetes sp.]
MSTLTQITFLNTFIYIVALKQYNIFPITSPLVPCCYLMKDLYYLLILLLINILSIYNL